MGKKSIGEMRIREEKGGRELWRVYTAVWFLSFLTPPVNRSYQEGEEGAVGLLHQKRAQLPRVGAQSTHQNVAPAHSKCRPQTLNPKPKTPNPKQKAKIRKKTRNPKPETRNPKPETRNPKSQTPNLEPSILVV